MINKMSKTIDTSKWYIIKNNKVIYVKDLNKTK